jgi:hypothetical protein
MDEFFLDEEAGVSYVTTHYKNNIDRMFLEPDRNEAETLMRVSCHAKSS